MTVKQQIRRLGGTTEYPLVGILIIMGLILLSPFVSVYLCYVAFLLCAYRVIRYDEKVFAVDYAVMIPVSQQFRNATGMSLLVWLCLAASIWYLIRGKIRMNGTLVSLILLLNYLLARMQMNFNDFGLCFGQMFVLYILLPKQDHHSAECACKAFCWSLLITSVYALVLRNAPQIIAFRGPESPAIWGTSIMRFSGLIRDPNYYMTLLLLGLAVLCKLKETNSISGGWFWSLAVALTAFGVLTYSKTFFLVFILLGGVYIIWQFWSRKVFRGVFFSAAAVLLAAYMLLSKNSPFAIVIERLTGGDSLSDFTTGRSELFVQYWNVITQNVSSVLFGLGLDAPILGKGTHNLFLEVLYFSGVVGLLLMTALYVGLVRDIQKGNREIKGQSLIAKYAALLIMVVQYMTLQGMFQVVTYAGLFIAILSIYIHPRKLHENQKQNTGEVVEVYDLLGSQTKNQ